MCWQLMLWRVSGEHQVMATKDQPDRADIYEIILHPPVTDRQWRRLLDGEVCVVESIPRYRAARERCDVQFRYYRLDRIGWPVADLHSNYTDSLRDIAAKLANELDGTVKVLISKAGIRAEVLGCKHPERLAEMPHQREIVHEMEFPFAA